MRIAKLTYLVRDYDEAIRWFTEKLGFALVKDVKLSEKKRWVVVAPESGAGAALLLAKADGPAQSARIGDQTGGRVFLFLESPRSEPYGKVAVFEDLYGVKWDLIEPR